MKAAPAWARMLPIVVVVAYLTGTVLLFAFGPWPWRVENATYLYTLVACIHVALFAGFVLGIVIRPGTYRARITPQSLVRISVVANLVLLPFVSYSRSGSWLPDVVRGLTDPGGAYQASLRLTEGQASIAMYMRIVVAPLLYLAIPIGIYYWGRIGWTLRVGVLAVILSTVALMVSIGMRAYIADMLVFIPWLLLAAHISGVTRRSRAAWAGMIGLGVLAGVAFFAYFALSNVARAGGKIVVAVEPLSYERPDEGNALLTAVPKEWQQGVLSATLYFAGGYYVLDRCLSKPWKPTYGLGHSRFLVRNASRFLRSEEFARRPYTAQVEREDGINAWMWFSTIYPWIASDVSFPGVVPVVFLIGWAFGLAWSDCLRGTNPLAPAALSLLLMVVFWFPALNRVQDGEAMVAFWVILIAWFYTRRAGRAETRA
ncbi:MAG: hypothetical protein AMXMBFR61_24900 [Fimbriimonadales bacterium]